jgi:hypothetical protein
MNTVHRLLKLEETLSLVKMLIVAVVIVIVELA